MNGDLTLGRRDLLKVSVALSGLAAIPAVAKGSSMSAEKVTIERRAAIVLIGINRPDVGNRIDPETYLALARALYQYDQDDSLRAAVLFGHGENFSRGSMLPDSSRSLQQVVHFWLLMSPGLGIRLKR